MTGGTYMFLTTKGLVLREVRYKEADRLLTVLTEVRGKLTVSAHGALGKRSRYGAATQSLCFSDFTLQGQKGRWSVKEAATAEQFLGLREDFGNLALGIYFAELLETVCAEDVPDRTALSLGLNALYALSRKLYSPEHIKAVFELRLMCAEGFEPEVSRCAVCGRRDVQEPMFSLEAGQVFCRGCGGAVPGGAMPLDGAALDAMRHIVFSAPKKIYNFAVPEESEKKLGRLCESFAARQLDRLLPSLDYWKSVK